MAGVDAAELGKLRWRCRRGMRELDELLTNYVVEQFQGSTAADQDAFRRLLDAQDELIHAYCLGLERAPSAELRALVKRITTRSFADP